MESSSGKEARPRPKLSSKENGICVDIGHKEEQKFDDGKQQVWPIAPEDTRLQCVDVPPSCNIPHNPDQFTVHHTQQGCWQTHKDPDTPTCNLRDLVSATWLSCSGFNSTMLGCSHLIASKFAQSPPQKISVICSFECQLLRSGFKDALKIALRSAKLTTYLLNIRMQDTNRLKANPPSTDKLAISQRRSRCFQEPGLVRQWCVCCLTGIVHVIFQVIPECPCRGIWSQAQNITWHEINWVLREGEGLRAIPIAEESRTKPMMKIHIGRPRPTTWEKSSSMICLK